MSVLKSEAIPQFLADLGRSRFWGTIQIDYQNGQPILVRKTETVKVLDQRNTYHERSEQSER
jgi:hypothetical protein